MAVNAVVVSGDVATVDLTERARSASPEQRQLLALQLRETLDGFPSFAGTVKITAAGADFDVPTGGWSVDAPGESSAGPRVDPSVDPRPLVLNPKGRWRGSRDRSGWCR
jgi:hypothetical protein